MLQKVMRKMPLEASRTEESDDGSIPTAHLMQKMMPYNMMHRFTGNVMPLQLLSLGRQALHSAI